MSHWSQFVLEVALFVPVVVLLAILGIPIWGWLLVGLVVIGLIREGLRQRRQRSS